MTTKVVPGAVLSRSTNAGGVIPTIHPGPRRLRPTGRFSAAFLILVALIGPGVIALAQAPPNTTIPRVPNPPLSSDLANVPGDLRAVAVPGPSNLNDFVRDPAMARALGKALFWDMQVGSDGVQSCASCHFRAGADPRSKNQLSPGGPGSSDKNATIFDMHFEAVAPAALKAKAGTPSTRTTFEVKPINGQLTEDDF